MKLIFVLLVLMVALSGCVGTGYRDRTYVLSANGRRSLIARDIQADYGKLNVHDSKTKVDAQFPNGARLRVGSIVTVADPNSAYAEADLLSAGLTMGGSEVAKHALEASKTTTTTDSNDN